MAQTPSHPVRAGGSSSRPQGQGGFAPKPFINTANRPVNATNRPASSSKPSDSKPTSSGEKRLNNDVGMLYVNDKIKAFEIIVVTEEGESLGKMSRYDALALAKEQGLDLVQLSYNPIDKVCTAKITDMGKYLYEKKKIAKEKKKTANKGMKQMKFAYGIGDNDLQLKISKIKEMLNDGYMVRVFVQLKGRENIYKEKVIQKLHFVQKSLEDCARSQTPDPKQDKNTFAYMFASLKK